MKKLLSNLVLVTLAISFVNLAYAEKTLTPSQIIKKSLEANYYTGNDRSTQGKMTIKDKNGNIRVREFKVLRLNEQANVEKPDQENDQNYFVKFSHPNDLSGVVFMVKKHVGASDDRWLYLPKLDLVKRIAAGDKRVSFVGSDVLYEDVSGRHLADDNHELISETKNYYIVKSTPIKTNLVEFSYYKSWIHKKTFLALKREYYDASEKKYRQIKATKVAKINDFPTIMNSTVYDYNTGSVTTVSCDDVAFDIGVDNSLYTERYLRNPPTKWFKN
jgi:hypothetical protein